jgi:Trk K+ transport system NAD-binding subunit
VLGIDTLWHVTATEEAEESTTTMELPATASQAPFVVCGDNPLAVRLTEMLTTQYERPVVAIVRPGTNRWVARILQTPGVRVVTADVLDRAAFAAANLADAEAVALVDQDDAANLEAALLAQEINPDLRIVIRMAKQSLGERIGSLLSNCVVLSASAIAAPAFVAAAVGQAATPPIQVGDRTVVGILRERTRAEDVVAGLALMGPRGTVPEVLPSDADERADLVLARAAPPPPARPPRTSSAKLVLSLLFGRRMRAVLLVFLIFYALGAAVLVVAQSTSWGDAAYGALITSLSGNPEGDAQGPAAKIALVVLTLVSLGLIPAITATVVDALVKLRLQREAGGLYEAISDHIVVVGLGDVGTRIVRALNNQGVEVVAIERDAARPGVNVARDLKIPVIIGDAARGETLVRASVATAQALIVASSDDVTNLETGLLGLAAQPNLRVVLRLFDSDFADRVRRAFNIHTSRSVSYLAAPTFAAAMLGRAILATIPVRRRVMLLAEIPIGQRSLLEHKTVATANRPHESRLLAVRTDQVIWRPSGGRPLRAGERIIVAATRAGLSRLLAESSDDSDTSPATPYRLLEPWELPQQPHSSEGAVSVPPVGPTDGGSTGPA